MAALQLNRVFLAGNLTRDPELRYTTEGSAVADMTLAVNRRFVTKSGDKKEETCFIDIVAWGRQAETCGEYLRKGSPILVEGRLQHDKWETSAGEKRSKHLVRADRIQFLPKGGRGGEQRDGPASSEEKGPVSQMPGDGEGDDIPF